MQNKTDKISYETALDGNMQVAKQGNQITKVKITMQNNRTVNVLNVRKRKLRVTKLQANKITKEK